MNGELIPYGQADVFDHLTHTVFDNNDGAACTVDADCGGGVGQCGANVTSLTTQGYTIAQLAVADQWDFTPATAGCVTSPDPACREIVSTGTSFKTCSLSGTVCESRTA